MSGRQQSRRRNSGVNTPFRPFLQIGIEESDSTDSSSTNGEVEQLRYQTITMLPEYRNKSLEELRLEDYNANRHNVRQPDSTAVTMPTFMQLFPQTFNLKDFLTCERSKFSNLDNLGSNIQFQPFIEMDTISPSNRRLEVRHQAISVMPEYRDKSIEELRLEDYIANRHDTTKRRPASTTLRPSIFRFGENNDKVPAAQNFQFFKFDSNQSQPPIAVGSFNFPVNNTNLGAGNRTPVLPENRDSPKELEGAAASSHKATHSDQFEDYALKVPLQSLPLKDTDPVQAMLDTCKFISTRVRGKYCNVFVTFCSEIQADQFIVIQILKTDPVFISGLRLYVKDLNGGVYLQRKLLYSDVHCKRNDFIIVWLNEDGQIKVTKNDKNASKQSSLFALPKTKSGRQLMGDMCGGVEPKTKSGRYQLMGDMCGSVEQLRAFIGDRKKAEPCLWKPVDRSVSSALLSYTIDKGSSLCLVCEPKDDHMIPVDVDVFQNVSTNKKSEEISELESSNDDRLCKICIDNVANVVLIPCGHLCLCPECALKMKLLHGNCPICRSYIDCTQKVFFS